MTTPARAAFEDFCNKLGLYQSKEAWIVFERGWNASLERAANQIQVNFATPFGKDTTDSFAHYVRSHKE